MALTPPVLNAAALTESGGDPVIMKHYFHGGKRVAMDREGVVQWLVWDHLGTTSLVLNAQGGKVAESRHYPYGEERWRWPEEGTFPTDYRFTGQRSDTGLGLIHMGARRYDPALGRWISADTLVLEPGSSQSYNRYAYVRNSPLVNVDPTGHRDCEYSEGEWVILRELSQYAGEYGGGWSADDTWAVVQAFGMIAGAEIIGVMVIDVAAVAVDAVIAATTAACADGNCSNELEQLLKLREKYETEVRALAEQARQRLADGQSVEEVARWAHGARRALGDLYKSMTPPDLLNEI
jgi:RHS repeat-associated protein